MKYEYILKYNWGFKEPITETSSTGSILFLVVTPDGRNSKYVPFSWLCNNQDRIACMQITSDNQIVYSDEWLKYRKKKSNLKKTDIPLLINMGCTEEDIEQINNAVYLTDYTYIDDSGKYNISAKKARELLCDEEFLSGLARSSFHFSTRRGAENGWVDFCAKRYYDVDGVVL